MVYGKAKIALNEINLGATVLPGSTEMLRFLVGNKNTAKILYSGAMFSADEAEAIGLIDEVTSYDNLTKTAVGVATNLGNKSNIAFKNTKSLIRKPVLDIMKKNEKESIHNFVDVWYS